MKNITLTVVFLLLCLTSSAQELTAAYRIHFTAKENTAELANPSTFLSQRAISRRLAQSIAIDKTDLPVSTARTTAVSALVTKAGHASKWLNSMYVEATNDELLAVLELPFVQGFTRINGATTIHTSIDLPAKNYGNAEDQLSQINLIEGPHTHKYYGRSKLIAVIDAGFAGANTVAFSDEFNLIATRNFVTGGTDVYSGNGSHGFSVLSCMAGNIDGVYVGSAPEASYALITTEDVWSETPQEMYNWVAGAEYADSLGADIINSSLGYYEFDDPADSYTIDDLDGRTSVITL